MPVAFRLLLVLLLTGLCGCGLLRRRGKGPQQPTGPQVLEVGVVDMVNDVQDFVIIHAPGRVTLKPGTVLDVMSADGPKAKLKLTPERKGSYLTADVVSGVPTKGDPVIWQETPAVSTPAPPSEPSPIAATPDLPSASISPPSQTAPAPLPSASISPPTLQP